MFIDHIILNNFRVYYGVNQLHLSREKNHHITIVAGNNGFGKTSFLTGLVWGLYGKLMADVDPRYRQEIYDSGGYKRYCDKLMNRLAIAESNESQPNLFDQNRITAFSGWTNFESGNQERDAFSVTLKFSSLLIPSVPCEQVEIKRTYYPKKQQEKVEILIDGKPNELTKGVGPEIFINDFILPKEIAKFFFFDAEKIVSLSEIKSADEKRYLSQAYAEVLGIKKYTNLRSNLENVRIRLRDKAAGQSDRNKLAKLQNQLLQNDKLVNLYKDEISERSEGLIQKRIAADKYQEQLIREGSGMTVSELKSLRDSQNQVSQELSKNKTMFNDFLELAPFAMAAGKMKQVQIQLESEMSSSTLSQSILEQKFDQIQANIEGQITNIDLHPAQIASLLDLIKSTLLPPETKESKVLLDFSSEQQNQFLAIFDNIKNAYSKSFRNLIAEQKRLQTTYSLLQRKLQDAESKEKDSVVSAIRKTKSQVDSDIKHLENELHQFHSKINVLQQENQSLLRQVSELSKRVKVEDADREKDVVAERIISKLDQFIFKLKQQKKASLEKNILTELNRLMHKTDFVNAVNVTVSGEFIDIDLYDQHQQLIDTELLSKGEQQLYATALLTALIQESNIHFPVFIDSPLQKFDKQHSQNIIKEFYPHISDQVVLFPLLQKELNEQEYQWLLPQVGKAYMISQTGKYHSRFNEVIPSELFNNNQTVAQHV